MEKWKEYGRQIEKFVRPNTYPLGLKVIKDKKDFPPKTQFPAGLGIKIAFCQANTLARIHGWTMGVMPEDIICWPVHMGFGWKEVDRDAQAKFFYDMGYVADEKALNERLRLLNEAKETSHRLNLDNPQTGFCIFPLARTEIEPDLIFVYGNPAQIMRLVQGYIYHTGKPVTSSSLASGACVQTVVDTLDKQEPFMVLSGNGERVFAMTQDSEMMFACPADKLGMIVEGMEVFHKHGQRYPVPVYQFYTPQFLGPFLELGKALK